MQPCAVCGGAAVDAAGYCHQCGTIRGAPSSRAKAFVVPLIALSVTLVILVVAIVVVLLVRHDGGTTVAGPTRSPTAASGVDECLVGRWRVTEHREDTTVPNYGRLTITGGEGAEILLRANGTGETDYGSATSFGATAAGQRIRIEVHGKITYSVEALGGSLTQRNVTSAAKVRLYVNDEPYGTERPFTTDEGQQSRYTCGGDSLTQSSILFETAMTRLS
jgi:hypothetical protein